MKKIRVGVMGAARGMAMIDQLINNNDAELVAVCDFYRPILDSVKARADQNGISVKLFDSFDDFLAYPDMDAVVLANYADQHAPYAIRCMDRGLHVMTEVLTCANMKQAVDLIECCERHPDLVYNYAENYCFFNTTQEMRRLYQSGVLGEIVHAEGEYIHDCPSIWPQITYGQREHWRNQTASTFYCTHSLGPIIHVTGLRPIQVIGTQSFPLPYMRELGNVAGWGSAMEIVTLENGAVVKSIHGCIKREPGSINYEFYGTKGMVETNRLSFLDEKAPTLFTYIEGEGCPNCRGERNTYSPEFKLKGDVNAGHGGSDYFTVYWFIRSILGDEEAKKEAIGVYEAVNMCIPGILAFKSVNNGNCPIKVPDLRNKEERDKYRNDTYCASKYCAGDQYHSPDEAYGGLPPIPDEVYDAVRVKWEKGEQG